MSEVSETASAPGPAPGIHFFALDGGGVLFCEPAQRFYDLNATAALCWLAMAEGLPEPAILEELVEAGAPAAEAPNWWRQSLAMFRAQGFIEGVPGPERDIPPFDEGLIEGQRLERIPPCVAHRTCRLFDTRFRVSFTDESAVAGAESMLAALLETFEEPADYDLTIIGVSGRYLIGRGMAVVGVAADLPEVMARVENAITLTAIDATPHILSLHGGVPRKGGCGLLLPAPSGSGKTTLTVALNNAGWDFGTDEISLLEAGTGALRVAPLSACIKEGSWPVLAPRAPALMDQPVHSRALRRVRFLPPVGRTIERCEATHVVFPRYQAGAPTQLRPLARSAGLQRLLAECVSVPSRLGEAEAAVLVGWASKLEFNELVLSDLDPALKLLNGFAAS